jgi:integrase
VDWKQGFITLNADNTRTGYSRVVRILKGDMRKWLEWTPEQSNDCPKVFNLVGQPIKNFRCSWQNSCPSAGVPEMKFHDLRRTAVRNMRRAGVPQVVRMRITGHRTDSMERRYNIVDVDDIKSAKALMEGQKRK